MNCFLATALFLLLGAVFFGKCHCMRNRLLRLHNMAIVRSGGMAGGGGGGGGGRPLPTKNGPIIGAAADVAGVGKENSVKEISGQLREKLNPKHENMPPSSVPFSSNYQEKMSDFQELFRTFTNVMNDPHCMHPSFVDEDGTIGQFLRAYGEHIKVVENEQNSQNLIIEGTGDWSPKAAGDELVHFVAKMFDENISGIYGKAGAKYSPKFFDKIISAVLNSEPNKVPPMFFQTEPTMWPNSFMFFDDFDEGCPAHVGLPEFGAKFKCSNERYHVDKPNWLGLTSYAQYSFHKVGAQGEFLFRLFYEDRRQNEILKDRQQKFIGFEVEVKREND